MISSSNNRSAYIAARYNSAKSDDLGTRESSLVFELKPEQQKVLDRAVQSGMRPDEVLDQAFAVIQEQFRNEAWMLADQNAIGSQIAEGFQQAERGELVDADEAISVLQNRRVKRQLG